MKKIIIVLITVVLVYFINTQITSRVTLYWSANGGEENHQLLEAGNLVSLRMVDSPHIFYKSYEIETKGGLHTFHPTLLGKTDRKITAFIPLVRYIMIEEDIIENGESVAIVDYSYFPPEFE